MCRVGGNKLKYQTNNSPYSKQLKLISMQINDKLVFWNNVTFFGKNFSPPAPDTLVARESYLKFLLYIFSMLIHPRYKVFLSYILGDVIVVGRMRVLKWGGGEMEVLVGPLAVIISRRFAVHSN